MLLKVGFHVAPRFMGLFLSTTTIHPALMTQLTICQETRKTCVFPEFRDAARSDARIRRVRHLIVRVEDYRATVLDQITCPRATEGVHARQRARRGCLAC